MKVVEGVPYYRFAVRFRTKEGQRIRWLRWSPGPPWLFEEIDREITYRQLEPRGDVCVEHAP